MADVFFDENVRKMIDSNPIYDLLGQLGINFDFLKSNVKKTLKGQGERITKIDEFLRFDEARVSPIFNTLKKRDNLNPQNHYSKEYSQFVDHFRYWIQRPLSGDILADVKSSLDCFYNVLDSLLASNDLSEIDSFRPSLIENCLYILLKVSQRGDEKIETEVLDKLSSFFDLVTKKATEAPWYSPDTYLTLLNSITALNIYGSSFFKKGITSYQFNYLIYLKSNIGTVIWNTIGVETRYHYGLIVLYAIFLEFGNEEEIPYKFGSSNIKFWIRGIISDTLELLRSNDRNFYIPLFKTILDKIDKRIKYNQLGGQFDRNMLTESDQVELVRLAQIFSSYKHSVTLEKIVDFLSQFDNEHNVEAMMNLLRHIKYFPMRYLDELIRTAFFNVASAGSNYLGTIFGEIGGSTSLMNYLISHLTDINITFMSTMNEAIETVGKHDPICIFDDCTISGTQCIHTLQEWIGVRKLKAHHTVHCNPVEEKNLDKFQNQEICVFFAIATPYALDRLKKQTMKLGLKNMSFYCGTLDDLNVKPFEASMNYIWKSKEQRENLKRFLTDIGSSILTERAKQKGWSEERRIESALGFSDLQRLLVFEHNVPKTTITPLWETGPLSPGVNWSPLFRGSD